MTSHKFTPEQLSKRDATMAAEVRKALIGASNLAAARGVNLMTKRARELKVFDTGNYLRAWRFSLHHNGAVLFNSAPYAAVIDLGRRPGSKMPPVDAILNWVMHKKLGGFKGKYASRRQAARGLAFAIARSIAKKGMPARHVMTGALAEMSQLLQEEVDHALSLLESSPTGKMPKTAKPVAP